MICLCSLVLLQKKTSLFVEKMRATFFCRHILGSSLPHILRDNCAVQILHNLWTFLIAPTHVSHKFLGTSGLPRVQSLHDFLRHAAYSQNLPLTCFHASFFPFCPLCWPPLFLPFFSAAFLPLSPSKSALFCRAKGTP